MYLSYYFECAYIILFLGTQAEVSLSDPLTQICTDENKALLQQRSMYNYTLVLSVSWITLIQCLKDAEFSNVGLELEEILHTL